MKNQLVLIPLCLLFFTGLSAQKSTTTRSLSPFEKVGVSGGFDKVILKEGSAESIVLDVSGTDPENIITEVKDNTLKIGMKKGNYNKFKATLTVTYRTLKSLHNSGSSDIETASTIKGDAFSIASSGSGNVKATLEVGELNVAISGSSDMAFEGRADRQNFRISGSGDIKAHTLKGKQADVAVSGSGDVYLGVDGPVNSKVSGSGNVRNR